LKIIQLSSHPYALSFKDTWQTARLKLNHRQGFIIRLSANNKLQGWGDCSPMPEMGTETLSQAQKQFTQLLPTLENSTIDEFHHTLSHISDNCPALAMALETALLDIQSQEQGITLANFLNPNASDGTRVNANIGALDEHSLDKAKLAIQQGFQTLKIKLAVYPLQTELAKLEQLFDSAKDQKIKWRLDANQGWNMSQAKTFILGLNNLSPECIDYFEEPILTTELKHLVALQKHAQFPLAIDESLQTFGIKKIIHSGMIRQVILKAGCIGGISKLLTIHRQFQGARIETTITSLLESAIGIQANLNLVCSINNGGAHGLATSDWFSQDLSTPPLVKQGKMFLSHEPGLGIVPEPGLGIVPEPGLRIVPHET